MRFKPVHSLAELGQWLNYQRAISLSLSLPRGSLEIRYIADKDTPFGVIPVSSRHRPASSNYHIQLPRPPSGAGMVPVGPWRQPAQSLQRLHQYLLHRKYVNIFTRWNSSVCARKATISQTGTLLCKLQTKNSARG